MLFHNIRKQIHISGIVCDGFQSLFRWKGLEAKFRGIAEKVFPVF